MAIAGKVVVKLAHRPLGWAAVTIVAFHPRDLDWAGDTVRWQLPRVLQGRLAADRTGQLAHQIARLEGHHRVFSLAIMTDGDPSMDYGIQTLDDVTRALL